MLRRFAVLLAAVIIMTGTEAVPQCRWTRPSMCPTWAIMPVKPSSTCPPMRRPLQQVLSER